jgi:hypothetical protein
MLRLDVARGEFAKGTAMGRILSALCLFAVLARALAAAPETPPEPKGRRVRLTDGQLFVPDGCRPGRDGVDLTLHLHGSAAVAEKNFVEAGRPGVLVTVVRNGLSSVYTEAFKDPKVFARILDEAREQLIKLEVDEKPRWRRVAVSSFSAGYGGVRELLKDAKAFDRIDALVLADSLYAGYVGKEGDRRVNPEQMAGFEKFARAAAAGEKRFILSHCELKPDGYASTAETADYLLDKVGGKREKAEEKWADSWRLLSRCRLGRFEVYGFAGDAGADHMRHLHNLALLWKRLPE